MSIASNAAGEMPIGADSVPPDSTKKTPPGRTAAATADAVVRPQAR